MSPSQDIVPDGKGVQENGYPGLGEDRMALRSQRTRRGRSRRDAKRTRSPACRLPRRTASR
jgi:hypothetical protein